MLDTENRPYVFLTSRVHPGESNASWVMKGQSHRHYYLLMLLSDVTVSELHEDSVAARIPVSNCSSIETRALSDR